MNKRNIENSVSSTKKKRFQAAWLEEEKYKNWLQPVPEDQNKAFCKACCSSFICGKTEINKHSNGVKHKENLKSIENTPNIKSIFQINSSEVNKVKTAEIKISAFFSEHNIAFQTIDHLIPVLKNVLPDSKILENLTLGRTKCTQIIKEVITPLEEEELINNIKKNSFSILIDESTDITNKKNLCCLVKYVHPTSGKVMTNLLELITIDARDCSAQKLFQTFQSMMDNKGISLKSITGIACDNAAAMVGIHNSFTSKLKIFCPNIFVMKCICHSSALVASYACREIPKECEELLRVISSYVSESAKSSAELSEFQEYMEVECKKILKPSATRWLTLHPCIVRLLENWDVLKNFFRLASFEDKRKNADFIYEELQKDENKAILLFLKYVLNYINEFNALFQSRKILIHCIVEECKKLILTMARNFLDADFFTLPWS